jgi:hypothetical protein
MMPVALWDQAHQATFWLIVPQLVNGCRIGAFKRPVPSLRLPLPIWCDSQHRCPTRLLGCVTLVLGSRRTRVLLGVLQLMRRTCVYRRPVRHSAYLCQLGMCPCECVLHTPSSTLVCWGDGDAGEKIT